MAFKKKEKEDRFYFSPLARVAFAKEMEKVGFDFDAFLIARKAIEIRPKTGAVAMLYETEEEQQKYRFKFLHDSAYFSLEAGTLDWAWRIPLFFWLELRDQSRDEENRRFWECDRLEDTRTGRSRGERAKEALKSLTKGLEHLIKQKTYEAV